MMNKGKKHYEVPRYEVVQFDESSMVTAWSFSKCTGNVWDVNLRGEEPPYVCQDEGGGDTWYSKVDPPSGG